MLFRPESTFILQLIPSQTMVFCLFVCFPFLKRDQEDGMFSNHHLRNSLSFELLNHTQLHLIISSYLANPKPLNLVFLCHSFSHDLMRTRM